MLKLHEKIENLEREVKLLRVATELQGHLARQRNLAELMSRVLAFAFDHLGTADEGALLLMDESSGRLVPVSVRTRDGQDEQVDVSETLLREVVNTKTGVLSADATYDPRFQHSETVIGARMRSAMCVPLMVEDNVKGAIALTSRGRTGVFSEIDLSVLSAIAAQASVAVENVLLSRRLNSDAMKRAQLSRFLSPALVEMATSGALTLEQTGELQEVTILFCDVRGFTPLSERLTPRETVALLNEHFEAMVDIVFSFGGVLDKYVGDALMALWGVPLKREDDAGRAVRAALQMRDRVAELNTQRLSEGREPLEVGFGLNTGMVVFGAMGASRRLELTAIGDAVNIASRLCSIAAGGEIVVSRGALDAAGAGSFDAQAMPPATLKGKSREVECFRVLGELGSP
jgi:adenylate cyclase